MMWVAGFAHIDGKIKRITMKNAFNLFGKALEGYLQGDLSKFYFEDEEGKRYEQPISGYFNEKRPFTKLERKIISQSRGRILDVGCGAGGFLFALNKKGDVLGIDNSKTMIKIARQRGFRNVKNRDIFHFKTIERFDTIVLLDENLGIAETVENTKRLLKILSDLLNVNGQILANVENVKGSYYIWKARCVWKNQKGSYFKWIKFNSTFLKKLCAKQGLLLEIIARDDRRYVAKITKS